MQGKLDCTYRGWVAHTKTTLRHFSRTCRHHLVISASLWPSNAGNVTRQQRLAWHLLHSNAHQQEHHTFNSCWMDAVLNKHQ